MWLMVQFDLPVETARERLAYKRFRKGLLGLGFEMLQKSIYLRHEGSDELADRTVGEVRRALPKTGGVSILRLPSRTLENAVFFEDGREVDGPRAPETLLIL